MNVVVCHLGEALSKKLCFYLNFLLERDRSTRFRLLQQVSSASKVRKLLDCLKLPNETFVRFSRVKNTEIGKFF